MISLFLGELLLKDRLAGIGFEACIAYFKRKLECTALVVFGKEVGLNRRKTTGIESASGNLYSVALDVEPAETEVEGFDAAECEHALEHGFLGRSFGIDGECRIQVLLDCSLNRIVG